MLLKSNIGTTCERAVSNKENDIFGLKLLFLLLQYVSVISGVLVSSNTLNFNIKIHLTPTLKANHDWITNKNMSVLVKYQQK